MGLHRVDIVDVVDEDCPTPAPLHPAPCTLHPVPCPCTLPHPISVYAFEQSFEDSGEHPEDILLVDWFALEIFRGEKNAAG